MASQSMLSVQQKLREQVASLGVEVDDKIHVCTLLEKKIAQERAALSAVEAEMKNEYAEIIEVCI